MIWNLFKSNGGNTKDGLEIKVKKVLEKLPWNTDTTAIIDLLKPTVGVSLSSSSSKRQSKLGGKPDLPNNYNWPTCKSVSLAFIAQINLDEVAKFDKHCVLPKTGILYFFIRTGEDYPELKDEYSVFYYDGKTEDIEQRDFPNDLTDISKFKGIGMDFFEQYTLPAYQNFQITNLALDDGDVNLLWTAEEEICKLTTKQFEVGNQILGEARAEQGDVNWHWAFAYLEYDSYDLDDKQKKKINELEKEFVLLLQVDLGDDRPDFSKYGGSGIAYFGILIDDLKKGNFDKVILEVQTT